MRSLLDYLTEGSVASGKYRDQNEATTEYLLNRKGDDSSFGQIDLSGITLPEFNFQGPNIQGPNISGPNLGLPNLPSIQAPSFNMPNVGLPAISLPQINLPNLQMPSGGQVQLPSVGGVGYSNGQITYAPTPAQAIQTGADIAKIAGQEGVSAGLGSVAPIAGTVAAIPEIAKFVGGLIGDFLYGGEGNVEPMKQFEIDALADNVYNAQGKYSSDDAYWRSLSEGQKQELYNYGAQRAAAEQRTITAPTPSSTDYQTGRKFQPGVGWV